MSVNMNPVHSYSNYMNSYKNTINKDKQEAPATQKANGTESYMTNGLKQLSPAAKELLERLRSERSDMDFMVADFDKGDDAQEVLSRGTKEFSVVFSSDELEKMAADEKYYKEKMSSLDGAVRMSEEINAQFGFKRGFSGDDALDGAQITKFGISFNSDGTTTLFAELTKTGEKQKEWIEKFQEKKADEKEAAQKEQAKEATADKHVTVQASTQEELLAKIQEIDWSKIKEDTQVEGRKFDFSV